MDLREPIFKGRGEKRTEWREGGARLLCSVDLRRCLLNTAAINTAACCRSYWKPHDVILTNNIRAFNFATSQQHEVNVLMAVDDSVWRRSVRSIWLSGITVLPSSLPAQCPVRLDCHRRPRLARHGHISNDGHRTFSPLCLGLRPGQSDAFITVSRFIGLRRNKKQQFLSACESVLQRHWSFIAPECGAVMHRSRLSVSACLCQCVSVLFVLERLKVLT